MDLQTTFHSFFVTHHFVIFGIVEYEFYTGVNHLSVNKAEISGNIRLIIVNEECILKLLQSDYLTKGNLSK